MERASSEDQSGMKTILGWLWQEINMTDIIVRYYQLFPVVLLGTFSTQVIQNLEFSCWRYVVFRPQCVLNAS